MMYRTRLLATAVALAGWVAAPLPAQDPSPLANAVLTGYGTAGYGARLADDITNGFTASVAPVLLFRMGDNLLFEAELELGYEGGVTTTALEYAQVNYLGFERFLLTAGKFLLPFGVFGERLHPSWINRMPDMPLLFGHAHGGVAEGSLLPILADVGAMARWNRPIGPGNLALSVFVTQGPRLLGEDGGLEDDDHAHALVPAAADRAIIAGDQAADGGATALSPATFGVPTVAWGTAVPDNNSNKMLGARLGYVGRAGFEAYLSGFHAMYDPDDYLDLVGLAASVMARRGSWDLLGEGALLRQEFASTNGGFETLTSPGYYLQVARRFGAFEPVARWSHLLEPQVNGTTAGEPLREIGVGLNYWITPSIPAKMAYTVALDGDDRLALQWAFGF